MKQFTYLLICLFAYLLVVMPASALDFDPDFLISDSEMTNYNSMGLADIENFLKGKEGTLKNYVTRDREDNLITATETFYETAQKWMINPKYLLVLVQKEMSLLTDESPRATQYDWATGYGCPDNTGCNARWQGFYKQVSSAAEQTRYYMDNIDKFHYQPGKTYTIDDQEVTIENTATAGLYSYTPHVDCGGNCGGNKLFWDLWNKYFSKKWPDGSVLQSETTDKVYVISSGKKREVTSNSVLLSRYDMNKIIEVTEEDLGYYDNGVPVKYHNFSLLQDSSNNIYMIVDDQKRKFESMEIFNQIGFQEDEVIQATQNDLGLYDNGATITKHTLYPQGALLEDEETGNIYYIISGKKKPIINEEILEYNFQGLPIVKATATELDRLRSSTPVKLPEGELIKTKNSNAVYVISEGKRMPFFKANAFLKMSYKWDNIVTVSEETLEIHPIGQMITGDWE